MASPLEGSIAKTIGKAMSGLFYGCVLRRMVVSGPSHDPVLTPVSYPCKGIVEDYSDYQRTLSVIEEGDRKVLILATSLAVEPAVDDEVTIRGDTYSVIAVKSDPAKAAWELQARKG